MTTGRPAIAHPLPDELVELIAGRFRALGDPIRIRLLERLQDGEASVGELTRVAGTTQQNISKHLQTLQRVGIVARRREAGFTYYRIADPAIYALCETVCETLRREISELEARVR